MSKGRNWNPADESPSDGTTAPSGPTKCTAWIWWSAHEGAARRPPKDHFDKKIPAHIQPELFKLMTLYRDAPEKLRVGVHIKHLVDGIYELMVKRQNNTYRLLFFRWGGVAVALDVFFKNQQKTPTELAQKRKAQWLETRGDTPGP